MSKDPKKIEEAYNKYGPGSIAAVRRMAKSKGLSQKAAIDWWNENGVKPDTKKAKVFKQGREFGMPIFSQRPGGWQFDTVCPKKSGGKYFLWFTNVNTKETRAYEMDNKDSASVKEAMKKFLVDTKDNKNNPRPVTQLTSDRDKAYSTEDMLQFFRDNDINYRTTTKNSKHILGVVNRNIKMIRDRIANTEGLVDENGEKGILGNMTREEVDKKLSGWNTQKNENLAGHSPKELTNSKNIDLEIDYIANKMNLADARREKAWKGIHEGQKVRRFDLNDKQHAQKNLDPYTWTIHHIDKLRGKVYIGTNDEKEGLVQVPRFQIETDASKLRGRTAPPPVDLLTKQYKEITGWQNGKYEVEYEDGSKKFLSERKLRGTRPLERLQIEDDFKNKGRTTTMTTRSMDRN